MKDPAGNEKNIREMSRFFYRVSTPYWRLIKYYSELHLLYWNCIPQLDFTENITLDKVGKSYAKMLKKLNNMNIDHEMRKVINVVFYDGVFYGYVYETNDSFFIDQLDPDYCKITQIEDGVFNVSFDFSYYDKHPVKVSTLDRHLRSQYDAYVKDKQKNRWQLLEPKKTICIKANEENPLEILPPLVGLFEDLIDLIDYKSLIRNREEIHNYKLLIEKIPTITNSNKPDDFAIDLDTAMEFHQQTESAVPEQVGVVLSPLHIDTVEFDKDTTEVDTMAKAVRTLFDDSGTSSMLFNGDKSGKVGLEASIHTDEAMVFSIVRQIERWIRRYIKYDSKSIKYSFRFLDETVFNRDTVINRELSLAKSSMPNKLAVMCANGVDPLTFMSSLMIENDLLDLNNKMRPLQTSFTQSAAQTDPETGGRPPKAMEELTDSGLESRDRTE